jgi:hypothetical protein
VPKHRGSLALGGLSVRSVPASRVEGSTGSVAVPARKGTLALPPDRVSLVLRPPYYPALLIATIEL